MEAMTFAEKLRKLCKQYNNLSFQGLADKLGGDVSRGTTGNWLSGKHEPRLSEAKRLAELFGVTLEYLADDTQDEPPEQECVDRELERLIENARTIGYAEANYRLLNPRAVGEDDPRRRSG